VRCHAGADIMTTLDLTIRATPVDFLEAAYPLRHPGPMATADPPPPPPALDLAYAKGGTSLVRILRETGFRAEDGREVLIEQGALAFERFFDVPAPIAVMREAVEHALRP
jgi:shikimate 5-dehydrogenase